MLYFSSQMKFKHVPCFANHMVKSLAKLRVDCANPFVFISYFLFL